MATDNLSITEWMVEQKIAVNGFAAGHIAAGLTLHKFDRPTQEAMCRLYRKWRPKTDRKNEMLSKEVYDLVLAGVDPDDVPIRQIDLFEEEDDSYGYAEQKNFD